MRRVMNKPIVLLLFIFGLTACGGVESGLDVDEKIATSGQALHPSGICRIESDLEWAVKHVEFFHISNPSTAVWDTNCDPWVGTAECCSSEGPFNLSYDECVQLRHNPDCPRPRGDGEEEENPEEPPLEP
jgi:hypothetical protein